MSLHSIAAAGLRTISQITKLHELRFDIDHNGLAVTIELLSSSLPGAPVVNHKGRYVGFISEFDVLQALESEREIAQLTAKDIMVHDHLAINISTTIKEAVQLMKTRHFLVLPVVDKEIVVGCLTRKDLLRAWLGMGLNQPI